MNTQTVSIGAGEHIEILQVGGDLKVQGWEKPDVQARGEHVHVERSSDAVVISCGDDLALSVPRNVSISVSAIGGDALLENLGGAIELGLVGGDAVMRNLSGTVRLTGTVGGDTHMEGVAEFSMNPGSHGPASDIGERIRRQVERASHRAEVKIRRAERSLHEHGFSGFRSDHWGFGPEADASADVGEPVSEEERMTILKMLQNKKITSEQAAQLLAALEGRA